MEGGKEDLEKFQYFRMQIHHGALFKTLAKRKGDLGKRKRGFEKILILPDRNKLHAINRRKVFV